MDITKLNVDFYNLQNVLRKYTPGQRPSLDTLFETFDALFMDLSRARAYATADSPIEDYPVTSGLMYSFAETLGDMYHAHRHKFQELAYDALPKNFESVKAELQAAKDRLMNQDDILVATKKNQAELEQLLTREQHNLALIRKQESDLTALNRKLQELNEQIRSVDLKALQEQNTALESEKKQLEAQKKVLDGTIHTNRRELQRSKEDRAAADGECSRLSADLEQCRQRLADALARKRHLEAQLNAQQNDQEDLRRQLQGLEDAIQSDQNEHEQLQKELDRLRPMKADLSSRVSEARAEKELLEKKIAEYEQILRDLANVAQLITDTETSLTEAQATLERENSRKNSLQEQLHTANQDTEVLCLECRQLEPQVEEAKKHRLEQQTLRDTLAANLKNAQDLSAQLETQIQSLNLQLKNHGTTAENSRQRLCELSESITAAEKQCAELSKNIRNQEEELRYQNEQLVNTQQSLEKLTAECTRAKDSCAAADSKLSAKRDERQKLDDKFSSTKEKILYYTEKIQERQTELDTVIQERDELERQYNEIDEEINRKIKGLDPIRKRIAEAKEDLRLLDPEATEAKYQLEERSLAEKKKQAEELLEKLANTQKDLSQKRLEYTELKVELDRRRAESQELEEKLSILRSSDTAAELEQLGKRIQLLENICDQLCASAKPLLPDNMAYSDPREAFGKGLEYLRSAPDTLAQHIREFQQILIAHTPGNV